MLKKDKQFWGYQLSKNPSSENIAFCAGRDVRSLPMLDEILIPYDLWTNYAHCWMLTQQKILTAKEWKILQKAFRELLEKYKKGKFKLNAKLEDVHTNIENHLVHQENIPAAKKIHTARSRNDQVTTTMRLYLREKIYSFIQDIILLKEEILKKSKKTKEIVTIGFSHYQPAQPTSFAHHLLSWSQAISRSITALLQVVENINLCPLGAGAGFGTTWNINRELSASLLGFKSVEINSLDAITSRGELEARIATQVCLFINQTCLIAQDIIMLAHPYFGMLKIDDAFVTGSSIMPQKKNPDFAEIIRAKTSFCHGVLQSLLGLGKGIMSGYNRDSQQSKSLIFDLFFEVESIPNILKLVINSMQICKERMLYLSTNNYTISADLADYIVKNSSLSFRDSYHLVALAVKLSNQQLSFSSIKQAAQELDLKFFLKEEQLSPILATNPLHLISQKTHTGAPSPFAVEKNILYQQREVTLWKKTIKLKSQKIKRSFLKCFPNQKEK